MALGRGLGPPFVLPKVSPSPKILGSPRLFLPPNRLGVTPSGNMVGLIRSARSSLLASQEALNATMPYYRSTATLLKFSPQQCHNTCSKSLPHDQCNSWKFRATSRNTRKGSPTEKVAGSIRALPKWGGGSKPLPGWFGALF